MHIQSTVRQGGEGVVLLLSAVKKPSTLQINSLQGRILNSSMIRILGTIFAGLLGLAFGSFLNVCLSRWPAGESIVRPRSHCRHCNRTLAWWENVPLVSWLALRGRCRTCHAWIGWRYPLVELAVGGLWAVVAWKAFYPAVSYMDILPLDPPMVFVDAIFKMLLCWLLVALAFLDAEHLWLPDWLTLPGIALGFLSINLQAYLYERTFKIGIGVIGNAFVTLLCIVAATALILLIHWLYWLIRRREGIGLGDAKLMALLAAWLGLQGALLAFFLGVVLGALVAVVMLLIPSARRDSESWALCKLPLGTFLCIGGIISSLWGDSVLAAYYRWAGF